VNKNQVIRNMQILPLYYYSVKTWPLDIIIIVSGLKYNHVDFTYFFWPYYRVFEDVLIFQFLFYIIIIIIIIIKHCMFPKGLFNIHLQINLIKLYYQNLYKTIINLMI
jgi:hypothetical protein